MFRKSKIPGGRRSTEELALCSVFSFLSRNLPVPKLSRPGARGQGIEQNQLIRSRLKIYLTDSSEEQNLELKSVHDRFSETSGFLLRPLEGCTIAVGVN